MRLIRGEISRQRKLVDVVGKQQVNNPNLRRDIRRKKGRGVRRMPAAGATPTGDDAQNKQLSIGSTRLGE
jgi:hypothetical protein